jgi:hypothetical protein
MYFGKDNSRKLGPAWAYFGGAVLLIAASAFFYLIIVAVIRGEIWRLSRYPHDLIIRSDRPVAFWGSAIFSAFVSVGLAWLGISILRGARRETK